MEEGNKEKQQYLFQEIIQKNYDPEQFQDFLLKAKAGGDDLEIWSFSQLKDVVSRFQKSNSKQENTSKGDEEKRMSKLEQMLQVQQSEKSTKFKSEFQDGKVQEGKVEDQHFNKKLQCNPITPSALSKTPNAIVYVTKFEKKEGGMFEQAYVCYYVNTPVLGTTVERRYSDFQWLKSSLEYLHPGIPVPPIAKKGQFRRYDDKHLRKRLMILEMFLNKILEIPDLQAEPLLQNFLKITDRANFQKFKANTKPTGKMIPFKSVNNLKGSLTSASDSKTSRFLLGSQRHIQQVQPFVKILYKEFKGAATALETTGNALKGLGTHCQSLDRTQRRFRKDFDLSYCPNNFFTILSEAVSRLGEQLLNQATIFRTQFYSLIKYDSLYMLNLLDSFEVLNGIQQKFQSGKLALLKKKERLFAEGNVDKWQLQQKVDKTNRREAIPAMLPKETKKLMRVRDIYGLYNNQMYDEVSRYFNSKNGQLGAKLQQCCKNETRLYSEIMMIWVDAQTNIMGLKENKSIIKC